MKNLIFQNLLNIFSFKLIKRENASSLIETLIAISLSLIIALIAYQILRTSILTKKIITNDYNVSFQSLRIKSLADDIAQDLNSHPLPIEPRIFKDGLITINNQHFEVSQDPLKQPSSLSDSISFMELDFANKISVSLNEELILEGCNENIKRNLLQRFIGLDLRGASYLQGEAIPVSKDCYKFFISQKPNLIIAKKSTEYPLFTKVLIPVVSEYLIYKDYSNRLRYVTLEGDLIKENQPIFDNAPNIKIDLLKYEQIWQLDFQWNFPEQRIDKVFQVISTPQIARQAFQNFVINP